MRTLNINLAGLLVVRALLLLALVSSTALSLVTPIAVPPLSAVLRDPGRVAGFGGSIWDRAVAAKAAILRRVTELSGAGLSRVDIRISGASVKEGRRVR